MVDKIIKGIAGLFSVMLTLIGVRWLIDPAGSAEGLGMPLLEGVGLSTQIGDLSSFFITGGLFALLGIVQGNRSFLLVSASLVGLTAIFRTLAWGMHSAEFATDMIVVEVIMFVFFMLARARISNS